MTEELQHKDTSYEVGYKKPPQNTRFKPGQSGNPRGRRKGSKNAQTIIRNELLETVTVRIDGKSRRLTKLEAITKRLVGEALQGNQKAMTKVMELGQQLDIGRDTENLKMPTRQEDNLLIERYLVKNQGEQDAVC